MEAQSSKCIVVILLVRKFLRSQSQFFPPKLEKYNIISVMAEAMANNSSQVQVVTQEQQPTVIIS